LVPVSGGSTVRGVVKEKPKRLVKVRVPVPLRIRTAGPVGVEMLMGLYSKVTVVADDHCREQGEEGRQASRGGETG
jgi:hypothetical protein